MGLNNRQVVVIFGAVGDEFVGNDVFQSDARESVDDLGLVDQLVNVDLAGGPGSPDGDCAVVDANHFDVVLLEKEPLAHGQRQRQHRLTGDQVQIPDVFDPTSDQQGSTPENRVVPNGEVELTEALQQRMHGYQLTWR